MNVWQGMKMAFSSILANKLRTFLTMLGIIIGVTAVIALVSIGQGTTKAVTDQVQELGTDMLTVNILGRGSTTSLTYEEAMQLSETDGIASAAPASTQNSTVKYASADDQFSVIGTNAAYADIRAYELAQGRFLSDVDLDYHLKVAVLGSGVAKALFSDMNPVGEWISINGSRFKVVGLLQEKGSSMGGSNDEMVLIPLSTAERVFRTAGVRTIYVKVEEPGKMEQTVPRLEAKLTELFRGNANAYTIFNQQELLETFSAISNTMAMALGGIAGISLLVGGIGIMNIMLVSVTERTREIGIRKAIGAKKKDILFQFLIESVVLSGMGGLIGVGLGAGISRGASALLQMDVVCSVPVMAFAFGFSVMLGILFGLFPANKAASLKPIEALRYE
ncbi:ABC transporter permease [Xylanibacillus composti]|uniref:ABC transporter permease n=1 Tax=Xylanibacillus composti TaxID=1572762 RepID=A0A8J4H4Z2_9BACL|nr:ABC transporter permease [Xylanibacillus composti]GIQ69586.1 ABC transporter permease [Xylanibacillus composti]